MNNQGNLTNNTRLRPLDKKVYELARKVYREEGRGISILDVARLGYSKKTAQQAIYRLRKAGLLHPSPARTKPQFYYPVERPVNVSPYGGSLLLGVLWDGGLWPGLGFVHDVRLGFVGVGLWGLLWGFRGVFEGLGFRFRDRRESGDVVSPRFLWRGRRRWGWFVFHRSGRVTVCLRCDDDPIEASFAGLVGLANFLSDMRRWLIDTVEYSLRVRLDPAAVPPVDEWVVMSWHFGQDSLTVQEVSGKAFQGANITFKTWSDEYARAYLKFFPQSREVKVRAERVEKPGKTLSQVIEERAAAHEVYREVTSLKPLIAETNKLLNEFAKQLRLHLKVLEEMRDTLTQLREALAPPPGTAVKRRAEPDYVA